MMFFLRIIFIYLIVNQSLGSSDPWVVPHPSKLHYFGDSMSISSVELS